MAASWPRTSFIDAPISSRRNASRRLLAEAAGDAEVEQRRAPVGQDHQVPRVQVAVEEAVEHRALEEADHPALHDGLGVDVGALHPERRRRRRSPLSRSITSTRGVTSSGWGRGMTKLR